MRGGGKRDEIFGGLLAFDSRKLLTVHVSLYRPYPMRGSCLPDPLDTLSQADIICLEFIPAPADEDEGDVA